MKTFLKIVILGPVAIVVMALAVVNNQPVTIAFDPFTPAEPLFSLTLPLYVVFFSTLLVGVLIGGFGAWAAQGRARRAVREGRREIRRLQEESERLRVSREGEAARLALPDSGRRAA